ncbi:hypothetical protein NPIL_415191 [Nephila pilipes]|uniref:Uncharacterized protein n=1 Tax=Nephila pilipes TaxID=299642 RepID=A0A8X6NAA8_NEPPI|nr:hypothetical protein NPIL_415191 [Nephila pilipes]
MARTKQSLVGDSGSTASCAIGNSTASEMPSLEMEISIETPNQTSSLDDNIKKCQNVQYHIEAYTETIQKITEIEAIIKKAQLLPFLYGPQDHDLHREELARWMEELKKIEEIRPNITYAQVLKPIPVQQRAALDGEPTEATSTPRGENIPKNNSQTQQPELTEDFSIFDAIKELKNFFQLFPGLLGACKQMRNTPDKTDKLNIFFQAICTQI